MVRVSEYDQFKKEGEFEALGGLGGAVREYEDRIEELESALKDVYNAMITDEVNASRTWIQRRIQAVLRKQKGDDGSVTD